MTKRRGVERWFSIGKTAVVLLSAIPFGAADNGGWGNRFKLEAHRHPGAYTAGFASPSFGVTVELRGWRCCVYVEGV